MELRRSHEGPEVVPQPSPQELPSHAVEYPHYAQHHPTAPPPQYSKDHDKAKDVYHPSSEDVQSKRSRRKWWVIGIVLLLVVGAAVGGGVGGSLSNKKTHNARYSSSCPRSV
jgi:hypothetical protein